MRILKYQVLLVDDEQIYLQYFQQIVDWEALDCQICGCANNGEDAIKSVYAKNPDIIFMDINMSQMDGLEVCAALKESNCKSKVIIMTAYNEFSFAHRAIKLNVFDYLLKPFDEMELKKTLKACIQEIQKEKDYEKEQKELFLKSFLESEIVEEEKAQIEKMLSSYQYVAVLIWKRKKISFEQRENFRKLISDYFSVLHMETYFLGNQNGNEVIIHIMLQQPASVERIKNHYKNLLKQYPEEGMEWVSIGNLVDGGEKLRETYLNARLVWENRIKLQGRVNSYEEVQRLNEKITMVSISDINLLIKLFELKEYEKMDSLIETIFGLSQNQMFSFL